jgi:hypothetical protein
MTHRAEEIVNEIDTVVWFEVEKSNIDTTENSISQFRLMKRHYHDALTMPMSSMDVLQRSLGMDLSKHSLEQGLDALDRNDPSLPSNTDVIMITIEHRTKRITSPLNSQRYSKCCPPYLPITKVTVMVVMVVMMSVMVVLLLLVPLLQSCYLHFKDARNGGNKKNKNNERNDSNWNTKLNERPSKLPKRFTQ